MRLGVEHCYIATHLVTLTHVKIIFHNFAQIIQTMLVGVKILVDVGPTTNGNLLQFIHWW